MFCRWLVVNREFQTVESRHHVLARARAAARRHGPHAADLQDATMMTCQTCGAHACPEVGDWLPAYFRACPACDDADGAERAGERWEDDPYAL